MVGGGNSGQASNPVAVAGDSAAKPTQSPKEVYLAMLDREIASLKTFTGAEYHESKEGIQLEAVLFGAWAATVNESKTHSLSAGEREKVEEMKRRVSAIQVRELPKLRAAWVTFVRDAVWKHNVEVQQGGESGRTLRLSASMFALTSNRRQIQGVVGEQARLLRFQRIEYRWYDETNDHASYTLETPADGAVRRLVGHGFAPAD